MCQFSEKYLGLFQTSAYGDIETPLGIYVYMFFLFIMKSVRLLKLHTSWHLIYVDTKNNKDISDILAI